MAKERRVYYKNVSNKTRDALLLIEESAELQLYEKENQNSNILENEKCFPPNENVALSLLYSDVSDSECSCNNNNTKDHQSNFGTVESTDSCSFREKLAQWAINENIPHSSLKKLLDLCRSENDILQLQNLPKDPRTLLHTPKVVCVKSIDAGLFYYFGIQESISKLIENYTYSIPENSYFEIAVNVDGLPISNSTSDCLWPILIQIKSIEYLRNDVIMVGLFYGKQKPGSANDLLRDFVEESKILVHNGICISNKKYGFRIKMLICDAPAKSYCLGVKGHSGYSSCSKCTTEGENINNVVCFPQIENLIKRRDREFREHTDEQYHMCYSIITQLPEFDLVGGVALDYMHLVCLGVTKRLLTHRTYGWVFGKPQYKLSYRQIEQVSHHLKVIRKYVPIEFSSRKTRLLQECKRYKATEFRLLLLYTGPVVFKNILKPAFYKLLLTFSVAISILCDGDFIKQPKMVSFAHDLLKCFVKIVFEKYGADFISHNVHNLLHLADDVSNFGALDNFSAFSFENYMKFIKKMLRKSENPLQQIIKRILEGRMIYKEKNELTSPKPLQEHFGGPLISGCKLPQYKVLQFSHFTLKLNIADAYIQLDSDDIVYICNITQSSEGLVVLGHIFLEKKPFFSVPCNSSALGIFIVEKTKLSALRLFSIHHIKCKMFYMPIDSNFAAVYPLRHSVL